MVLSKNSLKGCILFIMTQRSIMLILIRWPIQNLLRYYVRSPIKIRWPMNTKSNTTIPSITSNIRLRCLKVRHRYPRLRYPRLRRVKLNASKPRTWTEQNGFHDFRWLSIPSNVFIGRSKKCSGSLYQRKEPYDQWVRWFRKNFLDQGILKA